MFYSIYWFISVVVYVLVFVGWVGFGKSFFFIILYIDIAMVYWQAISLVFG